MFAASINAFDLLNCGDDEAEDLVNAIKKAESKKAVQVTTAKPIAKVSNNGDRTSTGSEGHRYIRGYFFPGRDSQTKGLSGGNHSNNGVEKQKSNARKAKAVGDNKPRQHVEVAKTESKALNLEKQGSAPVSDGNKDRGQGKEVEKKAFKRVITLDEYQKTMEENRKSLVVGKAEERKVDFDKDLESMQQLSLKKSDEVVVKVGGSKDAGKGKVNNGKAKKEKAKKANLEVSFVVASPQIGGFEGRGHGDDTKSMGSIDESSGDAQLKGSIQGRGDGAKTRGGGALGRGSHAAQPQPGGGSEGRVGPAQPTRGRSDGSNTRGGGVSGRGDSLVQPSGGSDGHVGHLQLAEGPGDGANTIAQGAWARGPPALQAAGGRWSDYTN